MNQDLKQFYVTFEAFLEKKVVDSNKNLINALQRSSLPIDDLLNITFGRLFDLLIGKDYASFALTDTRKGSKRLITLSISGFVRGTKDPSFTPIQATGKPHRYPYAALYSALEKYFRRRNYWTIKHQIWTKLN